MMQRNTGAMALAAIAAGEIVFGAQALAAEVDGARVYQKAGCVACHGADARGSSFAPALPGHTGEQVRRYVRNPQGAMPRFDLDKLSDAELSALGVYIEGLSATTHVAGPDPATAIEMHHWLAHHALLANDRKHAEVHLAHLLGLVQDQEHRRDIERIRGLARHGDMTRAARGVLEMMQAKLSLDMSIGTMHLRLALGAVEASDTDSARHYLEQYIESASAHDRHHAEALLGLLKRGDLGAVKSRLVHLLGN